MSNPPPIPTIGRVVLVPVQTQQLTSDGRKDADVKIRPGVVVQVYERQDGQMPLINVRVFGDGANDLLVSEWLTSLAYDQDHHRLGTWHWMPYQIQTAGTRYPDLPKSAPVPVPVPVPVQAAAPRRITQEHIDALLAASSWNDQRIGNKTTVVCLTLPSGFELVESAGCVDLRNYDHAVGVAICRKRLVDQVWKLEGSRLQLELNGAQEEAEDIARLCHEVNRAYCAALGDLSQPAWEVAPKWQQESAIQGVRFHWDHPEAGPEASHESWMRQKVADGWVYGPVKDPEHRQHPCLVPFQELPKEQQVKDWLFRAVVHATQR